MLTARPNQVVGKSYLNVVPGNGLVRVADGRDFHAGHAMQQLQVPTSAAGADTDQGYAHHVQVERGCRFGVVPHPLGDGTQSIGSGE